MQSQVLAFWHRRDLRRFDNAGLYHALKDAQAHGWRVLPVFIFDRDILDTLPRLDHRVIYIHRHISRLQAEYATLGVPFEVRYGKPLDVWQDIQQQYNLQGIYTNRDYEPYAAQRDKAIRSLIESSGGLYRDFKDHVIFEKDEVRSKAGTYFKVFTPFKNCWLSTLKPYHLQSYPTEKYEDALLRGPALPVPTLADMHFEDDPEADKRFPPMQVSEAQLKQYAAQRNFPASAGTSRMGIHLRFGTVSIRQLAQQSYLLAQQVGEALRRSQAQIATTNSAKSDDDDAPRNGPDTFLSELIWRDFYSMILSAFPHVVGHAFKQEYEKVPFRHDEADLDRWKEGKTGYPLVDAGMRELNATGYMHNRVRMVVASFLTKHLLLDWRMGEAYFAEKLLDFELASNNGGWQWAAGTGADAAPYFRIFNPDEQARKFDSQARYIRRWVPEYGTPAYPRPMVEHKFARERALSAFGVLKQ